MDQDAYDELLRRLTALVVKLDERDDHIIAMLDKFDEHLARFDAHIARQEEFNRQQVQINARLETLIERVFQERSNGRDA